MMKHLICFFSAITLSTTAMSKSLKGVEFPDQITVEKKKLVLNGLGLRLATIFNVKVYVGALYLEKKEKNAEVIMASPEQKQVVMHFLRDVDKEDLVKGFKEGLENNEIDYEKSKSQWDALFNTLPDIKENEKITITLVKDGITIKTKNNTEVLKGFPPANRFISLWVDEAPNDELKDGMLGL